MKQGRCKGDIFFAPKDGDIQCAGKLLLSFGVVEVSALFIKANWVAVKPY